MVINENNSQINSFTDGMNTDTSYQMISAAQYVLAKNLRFVSLNATNTTDINNEHGELRVIEGLLLANNSIPARRILASIAIRQYGIAIIADQYGRWSVVRFTNAINKDTYKNDYFKQITDAQIIFKANDAITTKNRFSVVGRWEDDDNVKLYIADGEHPIMVLNILDDEYNSKLTSIDQIMSYPQVTFKKPIFCGLIAGSLAPSMVQYSYQLYNKYGVASEVSPTTKLIPISGVNNTRRMGKNVRGLLQTEKSNCGVKIKIKVLDQNKVHLPYIKIYRISYVENGQLPTVELVYDNRYQQTLEYVTFLDTGQAALSTLTLEEYNSMSGIHIIPDSIESKEDRMFAANIKTVDTSLDFDTFKDWDARAYSFTPAFGYSAEPFTHLYDYNDGSQQIYAASTINSVPKDFDCYNIYTNVNKRYKDFVDVKNEQIPENGAGIYDRYTADGNYYGGTGVNIEWKFVVAEIAGDTSLAETEHPQVDNGKLGTKTHSISFGENLQPVFTEQIPVAYIKSDGTLERCYTDVDARDFFQIQDDQDDRSGTYASTYVSYYLKSLRRDEVYRYGIILYDKYGQASPVKWIADIRTPNMYYKGCEAFYSHGTVKSQYDKNGPVREKCIDLVVRPLGIQFKVENLPDGCVSYEIVRCNRRESDIATVSQGVLSRPIRRLDVPTTLNANSYPYTPTGFLTTAEYWSGWKQYLKRKEPIDLSQIHNFAGAIDAIVESGKMAESIEADNYSNDSVYQFVSPEVSYLPDSFYSQIKDYDLRLNSQRYLFGSTVIKDLVVNESGDPHLSTDDKSIEETQGMLYYCHPGKYNTNIPLRESTQVHYYHPRLKNWITVNHDRLQVAYYAICTHGAFYSRYRKYADGGNPEGSEYLYSCKYGSDTTWEDIRMYAFSYIKLYEQSNDVVTMHHYPPERFTEICNTYANPVNSVAVKQIQKPQDMLWNDFAYEIDPSVEDAVNAQVLKYTDNVVGIGEDTYCNWVTQCAYGLNASGLVYWDDSKTNEGPKKPIMGPGGRCLVLQIDNNTWDNNYGDYFIPGGGASGCSYLFSDTQAARTVQTPSGDTILNDLLDCEPAQYPETSVQGIDSLQVSDNNGQLQQERIFRDSALGTYLCNLRKTASPYGGSDFESRRLNIYFSYGDMFDANNGTSTVFDGDCFILPFDYVSMHKYYDPVVNKTVTHCIAYAIPVETNINLALTSGTEWSRIIQDNSKVSNIQSEPTAVNDLYSQDKPLYAYNTVYSTNDNTRMFSVLDYTNIDDYNKQIDYRCYYSNEKLNNEIVDSWTKYMSANYLDVDSRHGAITNLRTFHNALIFWQEKATGLFSVNERSVITDNTNMPLILGNGGILSRYDYIDDIAGMHKDQYCDTQSDKALYWFDEDNQELKQYVGGTNVVQLSKAKQVQNALHSFSNTTHTPVLFFDKRYNEVVSNVMDGKVSSDTKDQLSLVFNENIQQYTSLYDTPFEGSVSFYNGLYLLHVKNDLLHIGQWNVRDGQPKDFNGTLDTYIKYVVNKSPLYTKVYDNQELVTSNVLYEKGLENKLYNINEVDNIDPPAYFGNNHNYSWATDLNKTSSTLKNQMTLREGNYRYSIPRVNDAEYGGRIRGKYMVCDIATKNPNYKASLSYVITKFRMSWS